MTNSLSPCVAISASSGDSDKVTYSRTSSKVSAKLGRRKTHINSGSFSWQDIELYKGLKRIGEGVSRTKKYLFGINYGVYTIKQNTETPVQKDL